MIAKLKVGNPQLKIDYYQNYELTFPVKADSKMSVKKVMALLQSNDKVLEIKLDYLKKARTLDQNALLWGLLSEYAQFLNGGRRGGGTEEELYYKFLEKHGVAQFLLVEEVALETLKQAYRGVIVIDRVIYQGKRYCQCKCILGSSKYDTKQMGNLIDGVLDEMEKAEVNTPTMRALEEEWRSYYENYNQNRL